MLVVYNFQALMSAAAKLRRDPEPLNSRECVDFGRMEVAWVTALGTSGACSMSMFRDIDSGKQVPYKKQLVRAKNAGVCKAGSPQGT